MEARPPYPAAIGCPAHDVHRYRPIRKPESVTRTCCVTRSSLAGRYEASRKDIKHDSNVSYKRQKGVVVVVVIRRLPAGV